MGMNAIAKHNITHSSIILNVCFHKVDILENATEKLHSIVFVSNAHCSIPPIPLIISIPSTSLSLMSLFTGATTTDYSALLPNLT